MKSRDFVSLRCWYMYKNGRMMVDIENHDDDDTNKDVTSSKNSLKMRKSVSAAQIKDNMRASISTLSHSLGAKAFSDEILYGVQSDDDDDAYVDAEENEAQSSNDSTIKQKRCDKLYISTGISIVYDKVPATSKYTRYICPYVSLVRYFKI